MTGKELKQAYAAIAGADPAQLMLALGGKMDIQKIREMQEDFKIEEELIPETIENLGEDRIKSIELALADVKPSHLCGFVGDATKAETVAWQKHIKAKYGASA